MSAFYIRQRNALDSYAIKAASKNVAGKVPSFNSLVIEALFS
jgi:hypothetical protein